MTPEHELRLLMAILYAYALEARKSDSEALSFIDRDLWGVLRKTSGYMPFRPLAEAPFLKDLYALLEERELIRLYPNTFRYAILPALEAEGETAFEGLDAEGKEAVRSLAHNLLDRKNLEF